MFRLCRALHGKKRTSEEIDEQSKKDYPKIATGLEQQGRKQGGSQRIKSQVVQGQLSHDVRPSLKRRRTD